MSAALLTHTPIRKLPNSEEAVRLKAEAILRDNSHLRNRFISCLFHEGTLVLQGRVRCYYHKQIAQTVVADIDGVDQVINQIEVDVLP